MAAMAADRWTGSTEVLENVVVVILLHDTLEDTRVSRAALAFEFGEEVAEFVSTLTHQEAESRSRYLARVATSSVATFVKVCDRVNNLTCMRVCFGKEAILAYVAETTATVMSFAERHGLAAELRRAINELLAEA